MKTDAVQDYRIVDWSSHDLRGLRDAKQRQSTSGDCFDTGWPLSYLEINSFSWASVSPFAIIVD
jgi:hypothetical protein